MFCNIKTENLILNISLPAEVLHSITTFSIFFFLRSIYLRERESTHVHKWERGREREGERESQADSLLSAEHDAGIDAMTLRS